MGNWRRGAALGDNSTEPAVVKLANSTVPSISPAIHARQPIQVSNGLLQMCREPAHSEETDHSPSAWLAYLFGCSWLFDRNLAFSMVQLITIGSNINWLLRICSVPLLLCFLASITS